MKTLKFVSLGAFMLLVIGCASAPTEEEIANADYGEPVSYEDCANVAKRFIANKMKDPESARFADFQCYRGWQGNVPMAGVQATYGYVFTGNVNAKNSFGGYTGYTPFGGVVRDEGFGPRVRRYCVVSNTDEYGICFPYMVR